MALKNWLVLLCSRLLHMCIRQSKLQEQQDGSADESTLAKPGDLGSKPGTHMVERENRFSCSFLTFILHCGIYVTHACMHTVNQEINS